MADTCDHCGQESDTLVSIQVARATMSSPAEYELRCIGCLPQRTLTRAERLQALADAGIDTWEDYRGER